MSRAARITLATFRGLGLAALALLVLQQSSGALPHGMVLGAPALSFVTHETPDEPVQATTLSVELFEASERQSIRGPQGRVVSIASGEPVEGVPLLMRYGMRVLARTQSDAQGHFAFPEPDHDRCFVAIDSRDWRATDKSIRLNEAQSAGNEPLLFEVEPLPVAVIRGRLVDEATGEAVPHFVFQLAGPSREPDGPKGIPFRHEQLTTDSDGHFESRVKFGAGTIDFRYFDVEPDARSQGEEPWAAQLVHTLESLEQTITVRIGPTYRFVAEFPVGLDYSHFRAVFPASEHKSRAAHEAKQKAGSLVGSHPLFSAHLGEAPMIEAQLRNGSQAWARFRHPIDDLQLQSVLGRFGDLPADWTLELQVRSFDGLWAASATIDSVKGIYPRDLPLEFAPQGLLYGKVLDSKGEPLESAWIVIERSDVDGSSPREVGAGADGGFHFDWLAPGEWNVRVEAASFLAFEGSVTIQPRVVTPLEVRLAEDGTLGSIAGIVRGRSGKYRPRKGCMLTLRRVGVEAEPDFRMIRFKREGDSWSARFEFDRLPAGEYELALVTFDNFAWNRKSVTVTTPARDIEFVCEDDVDTRDLELRPIDARSGASIEPNWAMLWVGESASEQQLDRHWDTNRFEAIPQDQTYRWLVRAAGYRLATGDESAFRLEDDLWVLDVALQPGWGQAFRVTTDTKRPLEGVALFADGERIGVTDAQGLVLMDLQNKPQSLRFELEGWRYKWGRIDPAEEGFGFGVETAVHLECE